VEARKLDVTVLDATGGVVDRWGVQRGADAAHRVGDEVTGGTGGIEVDDDVAGTFVRAESVGSTPCSPPCSGCSTCSPSPATPAFKTVLTRMYSASPWSRCSSLTSRSGPAEGTTNPLS
jgi:hypothetical protein